MIAYHLEVTTFDPAAAATKSILEHARQVSASLQELPRSGVVFVAAIEKNIDHGNFYVFLNAAGRAHVTLHEHRELLPRDPLSAGESGETAFLAEDGTQFTVAAKLTTSTDRARAALEYWLPRQERWPQFEWE